ncbi:MAG: EAL domain-containing protein [Nitrospirota bacterium]
MKDPARTVSEDNDDFRIRVESLSHMADLVFVISQDGRVLEFQGKRDSELLAPTGDLVGRTLHDIMPSQVANPIMRFREKALQSGNQHIFNYQLLINTEKYHYETRFFLSGQGKVTVVVRNMTEYKRAENQVRYLEYHDSLTNLPNRYLFQDRLEQAIAFAERRNGVVAVLLLDIDNFKRINEAVGYAAGDLLLQSFADRLAPYVRQTDSISRIAASESESLIARLGGDEFTILLTEITHIQDAARVANRILHMVTEPFIVEGQEIFISVSIGIAVYPFDGKDINTLLKNADMAMYQAKDHGRNNFQYYSESLNAFSVKRFTTENKLRKAVDHNELMLFYQPQIDIVTGAIIGVEALIRWLQPDLILIKPSEFIPLAEESGLIIPIGQWILRNACSQSLAWQKAGMKPLRMTVNVSGIQFRQGNFIESVSQTLRETGLDPAHLQLELTESIIMQHSEDTVKKLHALQSMGIRISLDDFGTGYSSLNYLKRFPISTLKIDRSFIQDIATNPDDQAITKAIIGLAINLNLNVIAEGVETREQLRYLRSYECQAIQGYLLCPPLNPVSLAQFVKQGKYLDMLKRCGIRI